MIKHFVTPAVAADIMLQARGQHAPNKKKELAAIWPKILLLWFVYAGLKFINVFLATVSAKLICLWTQLKN